MIMAIDLGSTSFKAAVFDRRLRQLRAGSRRLVYRFGAGGSVELAVAHALSALRGAVTDACAADYNLSAIALTSQAQTFTMVDDRGRSQMPFVSWQDSSAGAACAQLKGKLKHFGAHCSFGEILPGLQICQLRRRRPKARLMPLNLPSYVLRLWTGAAVTDENIAAMSGLYSLKKRGWWPEALRACGLRERQLPKIIPVGGIAALTTAAARRFGLPAGIPVILAGNDQTAGGYAAYLEQKKELLITLGTAQVAYAATSKLPRAAPGLVRGPYPGGLFYSMAADECGGNVVTWAQTVLAGCATEARFEALSAQSPKGCRGMVFEPDVPLARGAWRNIAFRHGPGDLARAVLEALSRRMADLARRVYPAGLPSIKVAGGGAQSRLWRSIIADALGVTVQRTTATPLAGAARMALETVRGK
ncbi:MAG: FGGY-family carbohydrate kinase [Lentisphaerae bacterium]|nr:FGGY-family carbohydrate kinase [Lentisphaerota bacterium]